ncbi:GNAT family N-acetyltransferase [Negativibacillus massiliensis]|uniref:GNAT family N-acetyltransferase n=1 Tax=Negativibacillus massiliensis TaxID=1871035 RepID=UPI0023F97D62|nr:GNAT family N-acetyltransferase [Negativibacillus massiliensis]MBS5136854.1 GNAT family N-acetyltransferase [Clostridium sp.]
MFSFFDCFDKITGDTLTLKIIEKNPGDEQAIPFYYYDIYKNDSDQPIGKISIRIGHNFHSYYNGNLGYEIDEPYRGHHYAMIACQMLLPVAKAHGMDYLDITCNEDNIASYKTMEHLGAELLEICDVPKTYCYWEEGMKSQRIYRLKLK